MNTKHLIAVILTVVFLVILQTIIFSQETAPVSSEKKDTEETAKEADKHWEKAVSFVKQKEYEEAGVQCEKVLSIDPAHKEAKELLTKLRILLYQKIHEFGTPSELYMSAASVNSSYLAVNEGMNYNVAITVWDVGNGKIFSKIPVKQEENYTIVSVSTDGNYIAWRTSASNGDSVTIWDTKKKQEVRDRFLNKQFLNSICFTNENGKIVLGLFDGIIVYDFINDKFVKIVERKDIKTVCLSGDNTKLAIYTKFNSIWIADFPSFTGFRKIGKNTNPAWYSISLSYRGGFIVTDGSSSVEVFETKIGGEHWGIAVKENGRVTFSPDGSVIAIADSEGLQFWDIKKRKQFHKIAVKKEDDFLGQPWFIMDGKYLSVGNGGRKILVYGALGKKEPAIEDVLLR